MMTSSWNERWSKTFEVILDAVENATGVSIPRIAATILLLMDTGLYV